MNNPFSLIFGKESVESIPRQVQQQEIIEMFSSVLLNQQVYMITGLRGTGKTLLFSSIANYYRGEKNWEEVELNPGAKGTEVEIPIK